MGSQAISTLLDYKGLSRKQRIYYGFILVVASHILAWVYAVVVIAEFRRTQPVLDWTDGAPYVKGFFVDVFWSFSKQVLQSWLYYIMGTCTSRPASLSSRRLMKTSAVTTDISELNRYTGILRGVESFAQAVAYGLNANKRINAWIPVRPSSRSYPLVLVAYDTMIQIGINLALLVICVFPTWLVVRDIKPAEEQDHLVTNDVERTRDEKLAAESAANAPEQLTKIATRDRI